MSRNPIIKLWHPALGLLLLFVIPAGAHVGDRVYPIAYLSDEMLERIDLEDGSVDEWYGLVGEPTMTLLDFTESFGNSELDPSDLDFRIWLAWHDDPPRFYVAVVASDDEYINTHDYSSSGQDVMNSHDSITLVIDGDHGGGPGCEGGCSLEQGVEIRESNQRYDAIARTASGPTLDDRFPRQLAGKLAWTALPPYGEGGGGVAGETPVISVIELYVTPFDRLLYDDIEGSLASHLAAGQIIGFAIVVHDRDSNGGGNWVPEAMFPGSPPAMVRIFSVRADMFIDGMLLPAEMDGPGDSAVESVSWGRIKDSLEID